MGGSLANYYYHIHMTGLPLTVLAFYVAVEKEAKLKRRS